MKKYSLIFLLGNLSVFQLQELNSQFLNYVYWLSSLFIFSLFILGYFLESYQPQRRLFWQQFKYSILLSLIFFLSAFTLTWFSTSERLSHQLDESFEAKEIIVKVVIDSIPVVSSYRPKWSKHANESVKARFIVKLIEFKSLLGETIADEKSFLGRARLSWYDIKEQQQSKLIVGSTWQFKVKLKQPSGLLNPGGFDYEKWLFQENIRATGYIRKGNENIRLDENNSWFYSLDKWRQSYADKLREILRENPYKGIFLAIILGLKGDISPEQWLVFTSSGTNHLMAISGLHIGLMAGIGFILGRFFASRSERLIKRVPAQIFGATIAIVFALIYAALAGFSIPTQRALIMICIVLLSIVLRVKIPPLNILAYALLIILCWDPLSSLSMGFWLSFMAVAVILLMLNYQQKLLKYKKLKEFSKKETSIASSLLLPLKIVNKVKKMGMTFKSLSLIQFALFFGLMPLSIIFFGQFYLVSPIANFIVVPWMSIFIIPLVLLAAIIALFSSAISVYLFNLISLLIEPAWSFLNFLISFEYNKIQLSTYTIVLISLAIIGIMIFWGRGSFIKYKLSWLGLLLVFPLLLPQQLLPEMFDWQLPPEKGQFRLSVMDVGQGLSIVVQTHEHTLLYDTGDVITETFNMAEQVILPFLRVRNIDYLNRIILSHGDSDHAAAIIPLIDSVQFDQVFSGQPERVKRKYGIESKQCLERDEWQWDGVSFKVISPVKNMHHKKIKNNNTSCVILVTASNGYSAFLTGDIEKKVEKKILSNPENNDVLGNIDILIAPHHGSKTSSHGSFVAKTKPKHVVYSNAYKHHFNFPSKQVVARFKKIQSEQYSTINGSIEFTSPSSREALKVESYRLDYHHLWNRAFTKID